MAKSRNVAMNQFPVIVHKACIWLLVRVISRSDPWRARMHSVWNQALQEYQNIYHLCFHVSYL